MSFFGAGLGIGIAKGITERLDNKNIKDDKNTKRIQAQVLAGEKEKEDADLAGGLNAAVVINAADDYAKANNFYTDPSALPDYLREYVANAGLIKDNTILDPTSYNASLKKGISAVIINAANNKNFDRTDPNSINILLNNPEAFDPRLSPPKEPENAPTTTIAAPSGDETESLFKRMRNFFNPLTDKDLLKNIAKERGYTEDEINKLMTAGMSADDDDTFVSTLQEDVTKALGGEALPEATLNYINTILPPETAADIKKAGDAYLSMDGQSLRNAYFRKTTDADGNPLTDDKLFVRGNITDYGQSIDTVMQVYLSNENYDDKLVNRFDTQRKRLGLPPLNPINKGGIAYGQDFLTQGIGYDKIKKQYNKEDLDKNITISLSDAALKNMIREAIASSEPNLLEEDLQIKINQALIKIQNG